MIKRIFYDALIASFFSIMFCYWILSNINSVRNIVTTMKVSTECSDYLKEDFYYPILIK